MNKKGQVFLMAAIIIAGIMLSLVRISNQVASRERPEAFFDLGDEIGFEGKKVLDYGVINSASSEDFVMQLLNSYSEYIGDESVAFIYGDSDRVRALYYQNLSTQAVTLNTGNFQILSVTIPTPIQARYSSGTNVATIRINNVDYDFNLKPGQNFYFVLIKDEDDEKFVTIE